jgi:hypothetical protein
LPVGSSQRSNAGDRTSARAIATALALAAGEFSGAMIETRLEADGREQRPARSAAAAAW